MAGDHFWHSELDHSGNLVTLVAFSSWDKVNMHGYNFDTNEVYGTTFELKVTFYHFDNLGPVSVEGLKGGCRGFAWVSGDIIHLEPAEWNALFI